MAEATETALACIREEVERAFSSAPGAVLEATLSRIEPADECARAAAYAAWDSIAHPLGGLGDFEDAVACIAAAQGSAEVAEFPRALAVFFSDNGVVAEGVSQSGQDVTRAVARNMCEGAASACRMAAFAGAEVGARGGRQRLPHGGVCGCRGRARRRGYGPGYRRHAHGARERAAGERQHRARPRYVSRWGRARDRGRNRRRVRACPHRRAPSRRGRDGHRQHDHLGGGGRSAHSGGSAEPRRARRGALGRLTRAQARRGRACYRRELARSRRPDRRALEGGRLRHRGDVRLLPGGRGLEGAVGFYLGAAASKAPSLLDGVISCTAALCAARLCPNALGYLVGTHASSEPASRELLRELGIKAPLDAGMHLGEGAGAMAYLPLLDSALRVYRDGKTFTATGMAAYEHFEAGK